MKRYTVALFAICGLLLPSFFANVNAAAGYEAFFVSSVNKSSASIHESIQVTVRAQAYDCDGSRYEFRVNPSSCSATVGTPQLVGMEIDVKVEMPGGTVSPGGAVITDSSGYARFTLTSSTPGQKTVTVHSRPNVGPLRPVASHTVTFTGAQSSAQPSVSSGSAVGSSRSGSSAAQTRQTGTQNQAATPSQSAASPQVQEVKLGGLALVPDAPDDKLPTVQQNKGFKLSGKTTPNTEITIYVFSEPKMFKTKSDANGNWSVEIKGLPTGKHHAELETTDPVSGQVLPRVQLGYFKVQPSAATTSIASATSPSASNTGGARVAGIAALFLIVLAAGGGYVVYSKKRKAKV